MNKQYGWPTTRCYPRTMEDAFKHLGCDPEWFFPPDRRRGWTNAVMLIAGIMLWVGLIYLLLKGTA